MLARAAALPMNARERLHLAALRAVLGDDYEGAKARLGKLLRREPRDILALQMAHSFDYVTGDVARHARPRRRCAAGVVGRPAGLRRGAGDACLRPRGVGRVRTCRADARARRSPSNPGNARAHHAMAHVFEMTGRADAGVRWLEENAAGWALGSSRRPALLLASGAVLVSRAARSMARWRCTTSTSPRARAHRPRRPDRRLGAALAPPPARRRSRGRAGGAARRTPGRRSATTRTAASTTCMRCWPFVGAGDRERAGHLEQVLAAGRARRTRHGETTRRLGLSGVPRRAPPSARGNDSLVIRLLGRLPLKRTAARRQPCPARRPAADRAAGAMERIRERRRPHRLHEAMARFIREFGVLLPGFRRRHTLAPELP